MRRNKIINIKAEMDRIENIVAKEKINKAKRQVFDKESYRKRKREEQLN